MFKLLGVAVVLCFIAGGAHGQGTAVVTKTFDTSACTGTLVCTITATSGTQTIDAILNTATARLKFLKGTTTVFELSRASGDATIDVKDDGGTNPYSDITAAEDNAQALTLTFVTAYPITSALVGSWTCVTTDSANDATLVYSAGTALTIAQSDLGDCATTISMDPCAKTITCDLGASVTAVLGAGTNAVINFKKGTTTMYKIATANTVTDNSDGSVTGLTANAPVAASGADLNNAKLTFGATFVTFDSATLDGSWTCDVTGLAATDNLVVPYTLASDSTTLSTSCTATISVDACARTMSCTFPVDVATLQSDSGVISFKKAGTTQFQIAHANDAVTSDGSASVTGVTATAPVAASGTDAKIARLNFAATATFDSTLVDGAWTCEVDASTAAYDIASSSTTLSATCGAEMNKVAGLFMILMVAIKVLLF